MTTSEHSFSKSISLMASSEIADYDDDDSDDVFYDAEDPSADADELNALWSADVERRYETLKTKKDDVLGRVIDLIADVPQLRREVVRLQKEVDRLRDLFGKERAFSSSLTSHPQPPPTLPPPPPPLKEFVTQHDIKKQKKRRNRKKKKNLFAASVPLPLSHSTPLRSSAPLRCSATPQSIPHPNTYIQQRPKSHTPQRTQPMPRIHFYHDSNNKHTTPDDIQTAINTMNGKINKPQQQYNITQHPTFTLQNTLKDIQSRNLADSMVIIDTTTNNAKRDHEQHSSPQQSHNTLRQIITTLQQQHKLTNNNIIIMETLPSLSFDINPYNKAASSICQQLGVRFRPILAGESHLFRDGVHILHHHRWLLNLSVAAAIIGVDPHTVLHLQAPPLGPNGLWRHSWGSHNRPPPTIRWPPPGSLAHRQSIGNNSIRSR